MSKVWFITGASRGFGKEFAKAALGRGDRVAATARDVAMLDDLVRDYNGLVLPIALDVTDRNAAVAAIAATKEHFGRIDIVVNNAGYGLFGMVEEITEQQLRDQLEVNLFGASHVTQAAIPVFREQGDGHLIQISTIGGVAAFPNLGGYHASKWALEGLTESLAQEVAQFGIKVTLVEPGPYTTDWNGSSATRAAELPQYDELRAARAAQAQSRPPGTSGDPTATGPAILKVVDAEEPPLRIFFGTFPTTIAPALYEQRLATWEQWKPVSIEANG